MLFRKASNLYWRGGFFIVSVCVCDLPRGHIFREKEEAKAEFTSDISLLQLANVLNKH